MNFVGVDGVPIEILDYLDLVSLALDFYFIAFHGLLDQASNFSQSGVDSCVLDASVGGVFDCC